MRHFYNTVVLYARRSNSDYVPPDVGAGTNKTVYSYNLDQDPTSITRPDGQTLNFDYDSATGRLKGLTVSPSNQPLDSYTYDATTGKLANITNADGGTLSYTYNGSLLTQTTWAGIVAGNVGRTYDNDFGVSSLSVNGTNAVALKYDADGMLIQAGDLTLNRNTENGLLTETALGKVTDTFSYDDFGEVKNYSAKFNTTDLLAEQFAYDRIGRITQRIETIGGTTNTFDYGYDVAGHLSEV